MKVPLAERNKIIRERRRQGVTFEAIGKQYNLTKQRVEQIAREIKPSIPPPYYKLSELAKLLSCKRSTLSSFVINHNIPIGPKCGYYNLEKIKAVLDKRVCLHCGNNLKIGTKRRVFCSGACARMSSKAKAYRHRYYRDHRVLTKWRMLIVDISLLIDSEQPDKEIVKDISSYIKQIIEEDQPWQK